MECLAGLCREQGNSQDETNLRPKLPSLSDHSVEVAEREEDALELGLLGAHLEGFLEHEGDQDTG